MILPCQIRYSPPAVVSRRRLVVPQPIAESCRHHGHQDSHMSHMSSDTNAACFLTVGTLCLHNSWMLKCLNNLSPRPAGVSYDFPDSGIIKGRDVVVKSPLSFIIPSTVRMKRQLPASLCGHKSVTPLVSIRNALFPVVRGRWERIAESG